MSMTSVADYGTDTNPGDTADVLNPDDWFDNDGRFIPAIVGRYIKGCLHTRLGEDGRLWRYDHGVYRPDADGTVREMVRKALGDRFKKYHLDQTLAWLNAEQASPFNIDPDTINCANGLLDWRTGELRPHTPDALSTVQIPVAWNPDATCPGIDRFLRETLPEDAVGLMYEVVGYTLWPSNAFQRAVMLHGPGGNGKSVCLGVIQALLGSGNFTAIPLQEFSESNFATANVYGKLANICGDLDARAIKRSDKFKTLTGGDWVHAERKYGHGFDFHPFVTLIFSANELPTSADQTDAYFDRWLIVPFGRTFRGTAVEDPHLKDKLCAPAELEGLLVRAVEGLRQLHARGRFNVPASVQAAAAMYREHIDTVHAYIEEDCLAGPDPNLRVPKPVLYRAYRTYCADSGKMPVSAMRFNEQLKQVVPHLGETALDGTRYWVGVRPNDFAGVGGY